MLPVLYALCFSLLALLAICLLVFFSVAFGGRVVDVDRKNGLWRPPLASEDQLSKWANGVAKAITAQHLNARRKRHTATKLVEALHKGAKVAIAQSPHALPQTKPFCDVKRDRLLGVTPPEAIAIAEEIRNTQQRHEIQRLQQLVKANTEVVADERNYEHTELVCPLLTNNCVCVAFDLRPLDCCGWCRTAVDGDCNSVCENRRNTENDADAYAIGKGLQEGVSQTLEAAGLEGGVYELNSALARAFATPHAASKWIAGERIFEGCQRVH